MPTVLIMYAVAIPVLEKRADICTMLLEYTDALVIFAVCSMPVRAVRPFILDVDTATEDVLILVHVSFVPCRACAMTPSPAVVITAPLYLPISSLLFR